MTANPNYFIQMLEASELPLNQRPGENFSSATFFASGSQDHAHPMDVSASASAPYEEQIGTTGTAHPNNNARRSLFTSASGPSRHYQHHHRSTHMASSLASNQPTQFSPDHHHRAGDRQCLTAANADECTAAATLCSSQQYRTSIEKKLSSAGSDAQAVFADKTYKRERWPSEDGEGMEFDEISDDEDKESDEEEYEFHWEEEPRAEPVTEKKKEPDENESSMSYSDREIAASNGIAKASVSVCAALSETNGFSLPSQKKAAEAVGRCSSSHADTGVGTDSGLKLSCDHQASALISLNNLSIPPHGSPSQDAIPGVVILPRSRHANEGYPTLIQTDIAAEASVSTSFDANAAITATTRTTTATCNDPTPINSTTLNTVSLPSLRVADTGSSLHITPEAPSRFLPTSIKKGPLNINTSIDSDAPMSECSASVCGSLSPGGRCYSDAELDGCVGVVDVEQDTQSDDGYRLQTLSLANLLSKKPTSSRRYPTPGLSRSLGSLQVDMAHERRCDENYNHHKPHFSATANVFAPMQQQHIASALSITSNLHDALSTAGANATSALDAANSLLATAQHQSSIARIHSSPLSSTPFRSSSLSLRQQSGLTGLGSGGKLPRLFSRLREVSSQPDVRAANSGDESDASITDYSVSWSNRASYSNLATGIAAKSFDSTVKALAHADSMPSSNDALSCGPDRSIGSARGDATLHHSDATITTAIPATISSSSAACSTSLLLSSSSFQIPSLSAQAAAGLNGMSESSAERNIPIPKKGLGNQRPNEGSCLSISAPESLPSQGREMGRQLSGDSITSLPLSIDQDREGEHDTEASDCDAAFIGPSSNQNKVAGLSAVCSRNSSAFLYDQQVLSTEGTPLHPRNSYAKHSLTQDQEDYDSDNASTASGQTRARGNRGRPPGSVTSSGGSITTGGPQRVPSRRRSE